MKRVVTNLAVLDIRDGAFHLVERAPGVSVDDIVAAAGKLWSLTTSLKCLCDFGRHVGLQPCITTAMWSQSPPMGAEI